jgi:hypothetical protein
VLSHADPDGLVGKVEQDAEYPAPISGLDLSTAKQRQAPVHQADAQVVVGHDKVGQIDELDARRKDEVVGRDLEPRVDPLVEDDFYPVQIALVAQPDVIAGRLDVVRVGVVDQAAFVYHPHDVVL